MSAGIHHVSLRVGDLDRSLKLFHGLLGMEIIQRLPVVKGSRISKLLGMPGFEAEMVFLKYPGQKVCLELVRQIKPQRAAEAKDAWSGFGISLMMPDLDLLYAKLQAAGYSPLSEPLDMMDPAGRPVRLFCFCTDEGVMVELIETPLKSP